MTNLIIGIATGYNWETLEPFVVSLRRAGYKDRCILILDQSAEESLYNKLKEYDIATFTMGNLEEDPIVIRFSVISKIIDTMISEVKYVICVDTKDIVFQHNPMTWLDNHLGNAKLVVVSEGSLYENNVGNKKNVISAFGKEVYEKIAKEEVCNAGVIAGYAKTVSRLALDIYKLCATDLRLKEFKPTYEDMLPDQTAMNILLRQEAYCSDVLIVSAKDGFAFDGVFSKVHLQQDEADVIDAIAYPKGSTIPYAIFHQYFAWQLEVRDKYKE